MAVGHIAIRSHTRSQGHSAAAAVAYRCATRILDERTGELHDYRRRALRGDVVESSLTAGPWSDAQAFATAIETAERRKNSMILRDIQPAIPCELSEADQVALTADFAEQLAARYGTQTLWAVHRAHARGDWRNSHGHIVLPTRRLNEAGDSFGKKLRELDCKPQSSIEVKAIRKLWETTANRYLARAKSPIRVDCGRRRDGDPMPTLGPVATSLERRARPDEPPQAVTDLVTDSAAPPVTDTGRALAQVMLERRAQEDERPKKKTPAILPPPASRLPLPQPAFLPAAADTQLAQLAVLKQLRLKRTREGVARVQPPVAPSVVSCKADRDPRVKLVEVLIQAAHDGGFRLSQARSDLKRMNAGDKLEQLVRTAVDPELLAAVAGPRLASTWVDPLRAKYAGVKQAHPLEWLDVEKVWKEQRNRWRPQHQARAARAGTPPHPTPQQPVPVPPPAPGVRREPAARERPTPPCRAATKRPAAVCAPLGGLEHQPTRYLQRVATRERAVCAPLRVPAPAPAVRRTQTRAAAVCTRPVPEPRIEDLQHQLKREQARARDLEFHRQLRGELVMELSNADGRFVVSDYTMKHLIQMLDRKDQTDAATRRALKGLRTDKRSVADERAAAEFGHHKAAYEEEIANRQAKRWVALSKEEHAEAFTSVMQASLPALVERIRAVCQRVLERVFPRPPTIPPSAPKPAADAAARAARQRNTKPRYRN